MNYYAKISSIGKLKNIDLIRFEIYALFCTIVLDKERFKYNSDLKQFIQKFVQPFNYSFDKEYLFQSRTTLVAKIIRQIQAATIDDLSETLRILQTQFASDKAKEEDENEIGFDKELEAMLEKYKRK